MVAGQDAVLYKTEDSSSFANPTEAISTHVRLEWALDFDAETISGAVEHVVKVLRVGVQHVNFDSKGINLVGDVLVDNEVASYSCSDVHPVLGTKISVVIPEALRFEGAQFTVRFQYSVNNSASAVQWLPATATKGGKNPYVFTQSQAIHARTLLPCQDSPGVKAPYSAVVTAPKWCTVLMSALPDNNGGSSNAQEVDENLTAYHWTQPVPTPAYLIALAAGRMSSHDISDRVRIWAEPEVIDAAAFEFSETEDFLQAAEEITNCPYQWHRYDVVCLPPSFPYGGMENPCLTFATPTLLAGDRSLADVIAHEIAHSWTGNLVTNHIWDHFWLNEGWTVWLERKITSKVKKNDEVGKLSAEVNYQELIEGIKHMGVDNPFTSLQWPLNGNDPDDAFSTVPYEKGFNLLMYLESIVGRDVFEAFAQVYIDQFKFITVTTGAFRDCFVEFVRKTHAEAKAAVASAAADKKKKKKNDKKSNTPVSTLTVSDAVLEQVEKLPWTELFLTPGLPKNTLDFSNSLSTQAKDLARRWIEQRDHVDAIQFSSDDMKGWVSQQVQIFLETMSKYSLLSGNYSTAFLSKLDSAYNFSANRNAEVMSRWQTLCLRSNVADIVPYVKEFITNQGRMKFVRPLYRLLAESEVGREVAQETFRQYKNFYHPICRKMLEVDLARIAAAHVAAEEEAENEEEQLPVPVVTEEKKSQDSVGDDFVAVEAVNEVVEETVAAAASAAVQKEEVELVQPKTVQPEPEPVKAPEVVQSAPSPAAVAPVTPVKEIKDPLWEPASVSTVSSVPATPHPTPVATPAPAVVKIIPVPTVPEEVAPLSPAPEKSVPVSSPFVPEAVPVVENKKQPVEVAKPAAAPQSEGFGFGAILVSLALVGAVSLYYFRVRARK